jgi:hypothetical protein
MAQMTTLFGRGLEEACRSYRLESGGIHRCAVRDALLAFLRVVREPSMEMRGAAVNADLPAYGEGLLYEKLWKAMVDPPDLGGRADQMKKPASLNHRAKSSGQRHVSASPSTLCAAGNAPKASGKAAHAPGSHDRRLRRCLKCDATFDSEWAGARICRHCKGSYTWRNGDVLQAQRSRPRSAPVYY